MENIHEKIRVLMVTTEYPTPESPRRVPFIVRQVDFLRRAGVEVEVFHFRGKKNPLNYANAWWRFRKHLSRNDFDLIHAQWGQSAVLALPKKLPLIITFRGDDVHGIIGKNGRITFRGRILKLISNLNARFADGVIVVSEKMGRLLPRNDYRIIPSGLDLEMFRPIPKSVAREFLGLESNKKLVLFAASVKDEPTKRFSLANESVDLLRDKFDVELIVASGVPHSSIPFYMNACDALLLTSINEGSPNVVKEALACNLPVVSVDVGDVRQRIGEVAGCYVCDDDSPQSIASALQKVLEGNGRIEGRISVEDLDERVVARKVIEIYRSALANNKFDKEATATESLRGNLASRF